jgi:membrane-associated HD superfamily phosphohydrolase
MKYFLRFAAYLFHPLLMPLAGVIIYFCITPRFNDEDLIKSTVFAIATITLLIPLIAFFLLKNLGVLGSIELPNVRERKIPLMIQCLLLLLILKVIFNPYESPELYFFFVAILFSSLAALLLGLVKFKASLHQMGISGLTMFIIALSIYYQVNILFGIGFFFFANGWVASSRLHTNSHTYSELAIGFFIGVIPQIIVLNFWL